MGVEAAGAEPVQPQQPPEPPPPPPPPPKEKPQEPPVNGDAKKADVQAAGDQRREEINAGLAAGATTAQEPWTADAQGQKAYQQAYGDALNEFKDFHANQIKPTAEQIAVNNGKTAADAPRYYDQAVAQLKTNPAYADTPMSLTEVANKAGNQYRQAIGQFGLQTGDIPRPNPFRAADFMQSYANDPNNPMTRVSPGELQSRINNGAGPGDYFTRMTGEKYMHSPDGVLSPSPRAWSAPFDEVSGYKLNSAEIYGAFGLTSNTPPDGQRIGVFNSDAFPNVPADWNNMIETAKVKGGTDPSSALAPFAGNDKAFWNNVQNLDYQTALNDMKAQGVDAKTYAANLNAANPGSGDVFTARAAMDAELGVNKWFAGSGMVTYPDGTPGAREFGVGERPIPLGEKLPNGQYPEIAFARVNPTGNTGVTSPTATEAPRGVTVPDAPNTLRAETRNGALFGGGISLATSGYQNYQDVLSGKKDVGEALLDVGGDTLRGTTIGAGSAVIENFATRGINYAAGSAARTATQQMTRQALGSGVAGGIVNAGFAAAENYEAWQNGEISGAQYTGKIAGEAAIGVAAGVAGAYAGAAIGSFIPIPVVGTVAGAAVGFAVGMGVDWLARQGGVDKLVGNAVESGINAVSNFASNAGQAASNFFGGAASRLSSIFG
jgi:hypothetical protein